MGDLVHLRAVLYSLDLVEFEGEQIRLTTTGQALRTNPAPAAVLGVLPQNIAGVEEILARLAQGPATLEAVHQHLVETLRLSWETEHQTRFRTDWLAACGAVEKVEGQIRLKPAGAPSLETSLLRNAVPLSSGAPITA